ncbi:hypothetical protein RclHR1_20090003 [Rhizophagus clarus]|nr:hypothetical protein RclHR1_20090003 [Rhizophagus clarus]
MHLIMRRPLPKSVFTQDDGNKTPVDNTPSLRSRPLSLKAQLNKRVSRFHDDAVSYKRIKHSYPLGN